MRAVQTPYHFPEITGAALRHVRSSDDAYPCTLRDLSRQPEVIWSIGDWGVLRDPVVAVVGTRRATAYGRRATTEIVTALVRAGATIVSGMAFGIDAMAHRATLDADGRTVAVLGSGADVASPRAHATLHREIAARGLVVSEMPPGASSHKWSFLQRNRIIAALARLTIVVEAPVESGALKTAETANDLGREVAAVPGPIDSPQSRGCNEAIRNGVHPITSPSDALLLAGLNPQAGAGPRIGDPVEMRVWNALAEGAATLDELCARTELPVSRCLVAITGLELRGAVECALTGEIRRR